MIPGSLFYNGGSKDIVLIPIARITNGQHRICEGAREMMLRFTISAFAGRTGSDLSGAELDSRALEVDR